MKRIGLIGGGILAIMLIAVAIVPYLIPSEVYKSQIEKQAEAALGRSVTLEGEAKLSIIPRIAARVDGVIVSNPEGYSAANMIEAGELRARVKFWPLISGRVEIAEISLVDANVSLQRLVNGSANWEFEASKEPAEASVQSTADFDAGIDRARLVNSSLSYIDGTTGDKYTLTELNALASMSALDKPLRFEGDGKLNGQAFDLSLDLTSVELITTGQQADVDISLQTDFGEVTYDGDVTLSDIPALAGDFSVKSDQLSAITNLAGLDSGVDLAAIGEIIAEGRISGKADALRIEFDRMTQSSDVMETRYTGLITLADDILLDGALDTDIGNAGQLLSILGLSGYSALEQVEFTGKLNGTSASLNISDASFSHNGRLLEINYEGDVAIGDTGKISGPLSASSKDLRGLLEAFGVELAPGETLRSFDLQGILSGNTSNVAIENLKLTLDDTEAEGTLGADLSSSVPVILADLDLPSLDLSPFLGDPNAEGAQLTPWSTTPLALEGLRAVNADMKLRTTLLKLGNIDIENADMVATLSNGNFNADIASLNAFGGDWQGELQLDASRNTPRLAIDMNGANVAMTSVLSSFANLETVSGAGDFSFQARSTGQSLDALVRGLNGELKSNLADGAIKGFNVAQIVRSLGSIKSGLTNGSLNFGLSPEEETDFTEFNSALTITNGVANIDLMRVLNPAVLLDGNGRIDIANQTIDISITPSVDATGVGDLEMLKLNGEPFALPFRISGNWLSPSVSIDSAAISKQLQARAVGEIGNRLSDELGGELGGLLGNALGGERQTPATPDRQDQETDDQQAPSKEPEETPQNIEDAVENAVEDLANDALSDLFGRKK